MGTGQRSKYYPHRVKLGLYLAQHFLGRTFHIALLVRPPRELSRAAALARNQELSVLPTWMRLGVVSGRFGMTICSTPF